MVWPFFIFCPTSTNFFAPGSGARYAVPTIGEVIFVPLFSNIGFFVFISADIEVQKILINSLKLLDINDITLDINHLDIYNQLILDLNLSIQDKVEISEALMIKDKVKLRNILNKIINLIRYNLRNLLSKFSSLIFINNCWSIFISINV